MKNNCKTGVSVAKLHCDPHPGNPVTESQPRWGGAQTLNTPHPASHPITQQARGNTKRAPVNTVAPWLDSGDCFPSDPTSTPNPQRERMILYWRCNTKNSCWLPYWSLSTKYWKGKLLKKKQPNSHWSGMFYPKGGKDRLLSASA